jgi:hypothetical protein
MALTKAHFRMISGQSFNVKDYGAAGDGVADDTSAIQAAIDAANTAGGGTIYFPSGDYKTDSQVTLQSDIELRGDMNAKLLPSDTVPSYAYYATGESNIRIQGLVFEGTGTAFTAGTQRLLQIDSSSEVQIHNCTFRKARNTAVVVDNCDQGRMTGCLFEFSYYYGAEIRDGSVSWVVSDCIFYQNGATGSATSAFGRGLVLWEVTRINVTNCTFNDQTEYGLRIYSQTGDSDISQQVVISNCSFENNGTTATGKIDLYFYNELGTIKGFAVSNCSFRTRSGNTAISVQGTDVAISNCRLESAAADAGSAFILFKATTATISNCVVKNFGLGVGLSGTSGAIPDNVKVLGCQFIDCYRISGGVYGDNTVFDNNYFKQSSGGQDANITMLLADDSGSTGTRILNNTFDNCYRGLQLNIDSCDVEVVNNTFINSDDLSVRCFGTDLTNLIWHGNTLDLATNPAILGKIERTGGTYGMVIGKSNVAPTDFAFTVGDMVFNQGASAGGKAGWICTTAGTPGTWKPFGVIDS